ncbi:MAG: hypothetical protein HYV96_07225 [Opitutae bacterium]|nr:hypothetical protein [Opitutae bacterium]
MANLALAVFLLVFGLNALLGLSLPVWVLGALALVAGALALIERSRTGAGRR